MEYNKKVIIPMDYKYSLSSPDEFIDPILFDINSLLMKKINKSITYWPDSVLTFNISLDELNKVVLISVSYIKEIKEIKLSSINFLTEFIDYFSVYFSKDKDILKLINNIKKNPELYDYQINNIKKEYYFEPNIIDLSK